VQQRLSPAACEAFQQSVAAAVDNNLRLYRQRLQQAQQQLLQRELGSAAQGQDDSSSSNSAQGQQECTAAAGCALQDAGRDVAAAESCVADGFDRVKQLGVGGGTADSTLSSISSGSGFHAAVLPASGAMQQRGCGAAGGTLPGISGDGGVDAAVPRASATMQQRGYGAAGVQFHDVGVDAAVLTMQQLVALLAKRDAQPEDQQEWQATER
jgi:hypothetical protein